MTVVQVCFGLFKMVFGSRGSGLFRVLGLFRV